MALKKLNPIIIYHKKKSGLDPVARDNALQYIESYWPKLQKTNKSDKGTLVGLPNPYLVPTADHTAGFIFEEQYYWDSFFTALGLHGKQHQKLVEGMLDNLIDLYKRFGMIPNASRMYFTSRSQPPLLTTYIFHIYDTYGKDLKWLKEHLAVAQDEYETVWMNNKHPQWHQVYQGLSRYYDVNVLHDLAEAESGWDMTPRFERKCLDYLPVDLNALLYKYEADFLRAAKMENAKDSVERWEKALATRQQNMNELMWKKQRGFYFDFNYQKKSNGDVWSLAGFYPMWAGMVSAEQAKQMVKNLDKFEKVGGLTTTARPLIDTNGLFGSIKAQWAYPNGWAPLHYFVIEGLKRYGYHEEARRIALKWVKTNVDWFKVHNEFIEKYNVVRPNKPPLEGVYPSQIGFGWTNALCAKFIRDFQL